jgi:hypothetical protein
MACIATVCDAVLRKVACDIPSPLSQHYDGSANGPVSRFVIEMRQFAAESAVFLMVDPSLTIVRTAVLDYFSQQRRGVQDDHVLFSFERSMMCGPAEELLIDQLCLEIGYPRPAEAEFGSVHESATATTTASSGAKSMWPFKSTSAARKVQVTLAAQYMTGERPEVRL